VTSKKSILQKEERLQARKRPVSNEIERDRKFVYVCMYVCTDVCLTDVFHHCKEKNNNMSTTKTRKKKKKKKKKGQQIKLAIPNVQKNMSTSLEREREKIEFFFVLLEGE
jgi:hypothetical protein